MTTLLIEYEREADGRHIAEIPALPGCLVYGTTKREALLAVVALAVDIEEPAPVVASEATDAAHYMAVFDLGPEDAEDAAEHIAAIRAATDPLAAVHEAAAWGTCQEEAEKVADLWCRMHGRPLTEVWRLAARAHGTYADAEQEAAIRALVGMVRA